MKIKKWVQAVGLFVGLYILLQVMMSLVVYFSQESLLEFFSFLRYLPESGRLVFLFILQSLVLLFLFWLAFVWWRRQGKKQMSLQQYLRKRWQRKWWGMFWKYVLWWLFIYIFFSGIVWGLIQYYDLHIPGFYGEQMVMTLLQWISLETWWDKVLIFLLVAIVAPVVEEIIWRGFVTDRLMKSRQGEGVFLASLLFATAHMEWWVVWNLVILSFLLWYIYRKTESLRYSLLFHFLINGIAMGVLFLQY